VANTVSVGSVGNERTIVNLAAGTLSAVSTDAVNGSQLFATNQLVSSIAGSSIYFQANSIGPAAVAAGTDAAAVGPNAVASGDSSLAFGNGAAATQSGAIAFGLNA
jgi:autotransporter adhesin